MTEFRTRRLHDPEKWYELGEHFKHLSTDFVGDEWTYSRSSLILKKALHRQEDSLHVSE